METPFRKAPSTPHRRSNSASSFLNQVTNSHFPIDENALPLEVVLGPSSSAKMMEELSDGMATLEMNLQHLNKVHNSLSEFNESFSALLHCFKMNAWCVEFTEAPSTASFAVDRDEPQPVEPEAPGSLDYSDVSFFTSELTENILNAAPPMISGSRKAPRGSVSVSTQSRFGRPGSSSTSLSVSGSSSSTTASKSRIPRPSTTNKSRIQRGQPVWK
jgi:hypothetical protein